MEPLLHAELDEKLNRADPDLSPAELSLMAIRAGEKYGGSSDPFAQHKRESNELALSLLPHLRQEIRQSPDPLFTASKLAACGNIIDLGMYEEYDIHATIRKVMREGFSLNSFPQFRNDLTSCHEEREHPTLLYICDNAGEIGFDRLFIEEILREFPRFKITAVVRMQPVLNDATLEDAQTVGLDQIVRVIHNGTAEIGTVLHKSPPEFVETFMTSDLIVSKGQANYETLCLQPENIYFILKAKCEIIADSLGVQFLDAVMTHSSYLKAIRKEK
jgi:uncharacterized protein with ATP-grasp and redox domains